MPTERIPSSVPSDLTLPLATKTSSSILNIEKQANDPLQVLATQKKVSFDDVSSNPYAQRRAPPAVVENIDVIKHERMQPSGFFRKQLQFSQRNPEPPTQVKQETQPSETRPAPPAVDEDLIVSDARFNTLNPSSNQNQHSNNNDSSDDESSQTNGVMSPNDEDILSGRGAGVNLHPGNVFFRKLIQANKAIYLKADPGEKKRIIRRIVEKAQTHGRFLKQDPDSELWTKISSDEARKKTGQALRENGPAIKKQHKEHMKRKYEAQFSSLPAATYVALQQTRSSSPMKSNDVCSNRLKSNAAASVAARDASTSSSSSLQSALPSSLPSSVATAANTVTTNLLWSRMNMLQEKQEQLKRKQRELEDEQNELMQCFYQLTALSTSNAAASATHRVYDSHHYPITTSLTRAEFEARYKEMERLNRLYAATRGSAGTESGSDCDSASDRRLHPLYAKVAKKRRIMVSGH